MPQATPLGASGVGTPEYNLCRYPKPTKVIAQGIREACGGPSYTPPTEQKQRAGQKSQASCYRSNSAGDSSSFRSEVIYSAATAPSTTRWSPLRVMLILWPISISSRLLTTGFLTMAPTARIAAWGGLTMAQNCSIP